MTTHSYIDELIERNSILAKQVAELLPWAKLGASQSRTDRNWDEAVRMTERINNKEFGEIK